MRFLVELGSPESAHYSVFCCSHIIFAFFIFLVIDVSVALWNFLFELYVTTHHEISDQVWVFLHAVSLVTAVSGSAALCEVTPAILVYGGRICLVLGITIARFIFSIHEISAVEEPSVAELLNLFQIIPVVVYTIGVFLVMRLFSYSTGRYRGYYDVDVELRKEVKRKFAEFEARSPTPPDEGGEAPATTTRKTD